MKLAGVELRKLRVPLRTPFRTALREIDFLEDIVVVLETDGGRRGYGSAPSTAAITGETLGSIVETVRSTIAPRIVGEDASDINRIADLVQTSIFRNFSAKAAVEIAAYDLFAQSLGAPLYKVLGGGTPRLSTDLTISLNPVDEMVDDALQAVADGFKALKVKVGTDPALDIDRIRAICDAVGGRAGIRLDANQGWTPKQTVSALRRLESEGIELELIEQPVRGDDIDGMRYITERVATPVMADESVFGPKELIDLIRRRAADLVNIKLMKTGGISNAIRLADIAALYDMECMMGCMAETCIGVSAAAHVAVAKSGIVTRVDLDAPALAAIRPLTGNVVFDGAEIRLGDSAGLGMERANQPCGEVFDELVAQ